MAGVFSITLGVSVVGLLSLLLLKRYELKTGRIALRRVRPGVSGLFQRCAFFVGEVVPSRIAQAFQRGVYYLRQAFHRLVARAILGFEYFLEHTLHVVRRTSQTPREGEASVFLREVAEHKKKLLRRAPKNRAIFED